MSVEGCQNVDVVIPADFQARLRQAVGLFWRVRAGQSAAQGLGGERDRGGRAAVTGGKQCGGLARLVVELLLMNGVPAESIFLDRCLELPGYFRPTKKWDLLVVHSGRLLAVAELKSQAGPSFSNNANNRAEEAIGSAQDIWTAYREGAFGLSRQPWLGYLFMLEDSQVSRRPVATEEPHFAVFPEFRDASYAKRYEEMCRRLVRERLYTDAALVMSRRGDFDGATLSEPASDLAVRPFVRSLLMAVRSGMLADR